MAADGRSESSRSMRPPWPGSVPMSFMPRSRFTSDSPRSPRSPARDRDAEDQRPPTTGRGRTNVSSSVADAMQASSDPAKPSHDFFGLMAGTIGCLPNNTPAA